MFLFFLSHRVVEHGTRYIQYWRRVSRDILSSEESCISVLIWNWFNIKGCFGLVYRDVASKLGITGFKSYLLIHSGHVSLSKSLS